MVDPSQQCCWLAIVVLVIIASSAVSVLTACPYTSIFSFGDSIVDTGNFNFISQQPPHHCLRPPYGQTYFHHPTGRCSDGRLITDFIAEYLGISLLKPYLGIKNGGLENWSLNEGANFAVAGCTALDVSFLEEKGIDMKGHTNYSLSVQLNWFKELLDALCISTTSCQQVLRNSLFLVGEIGGNDIKFAFFQGKSMAEIKTYVPHVINAITSTINELIDLGAQTLMVPGNFPIGCSAMFLANYETKDKNQYDAAGCLKWVNEFAEYYNQKLQNELNRLRVLHSHANIIYLDYYYAALPLYQNPTKFGFTGLKICCGKGDPYNYNASAMCGTLGVNACDNPSQYIGWDGVHFTEAAYGLITEGLINGPHSLPHFNTLCFTNTSFGDFSNQISVS